jgi:hypothetical protein
MAMPIKRRAPKARGFKLAAAREHWREHGRACFDGNLITCERMAELVGWLPHIAMPSSKAAGLIAEIDDAD